MPYHGIRPCRKCSLRKFELVRDCGRTAIIKCSACGTERRIKWSLYINPQRFEKEAKANAEQAECSHNENAEDENSTNQCEEDD